MRAGGERHPEDPVPHVARRRRVRVAGQPPATLRPDPRKPASVERLASSLADIEEARRARRRHPAAADAPFPRTASTRPVAAIHARRCILVAQWRQRADLKRAASGTPGASRRRGSASGRCRVLCLAPPTSRLQRSPDHYGRAVLSGGIYSRDRIVQPSVPVHDLAMPLPPVYQAPKRPADNEFYDRGGDLVEAATAIRRLAGDPRAGRGCRRCSDASKRRSINWAARRRPSTRPATRCRPRPWRIGCITAS